MSQPTSFVNCFIRYRSTVRFLYASYVALSHALSGGSCLPSPSLFLVLVYCSDVGFLILRMVTFFVIEILL